MKIDRFFRYWVDIVREEKKAGYNFQFQMHSKYNIDWKFIDVLGKLFDNKRKWGNEFEVNWTEFLINCVFPQKLYEEARCDIYKLMEHPKILVANQKGASPNRAFSYFGRLCDWYDYENDHGNHFNQIAYLLKRMTVVPSHLTKPIYGLNSFTFYTTSPHWVYKLLNDNPNMPKTGRTNEACMFLVSFNYYNKELNITIAFRNLYVSKIYAEFVGAKLMLEAICKECNIKAGLITVQALHMDIDDKKKLLAVIETLENKLGRTITLK